MVQVHNARLLIVSPHQCWFISCVQDEKAASAVWAMKMDDELKGQAVQVRVVQNKEPPHFYMMFKGTLVIHEGGHASGFKNREDKDSYDTDGTSLFQVRAAEGESTQWTLIFRFIFPSCSW